MRTISAAPAAETPSAGFRAVDLFAGAGGFALGLTLAGFDVRLGSDWWPPAGETYRKNFPDHPFVTVDARDLTARTLRDAVGADATGQPWILAGGPPCQGFSSAGARRSDDHRNTLVGVYATLAAEAGPDVVVFENVEGFLTAEGGRYVFDLLEPLIEAGYRVSLRKVNVANFGVPQLRKRVIAIAALGRDPVDPAPTHQAFGAPGAMRTARWLPPTRCLDDALEGLPDPSPTAPGNPSLHVARPLKPHDLDRVTALKPGQTMRDLPPEMWHPSYARRANRRVGDGTPTEKRGGAPAGMRRLLGHEPSKAITSAAMREFVHPRENRYLTLRECARLQTFPDEFEFAGTLQQIATQIGNAVPPEFAHQLGVAVSDTLASPRKDLPGALVSFFPTASEGTSPALARVSAAVRDRYMSLQGEDEGLQLELTIT